MTGTRHRRFRATTANGLAIALIASLAVVAGVSPAVAGAPSTKGGGKTITLGNQKLTRCHSGPTAYCATLKVPLDYSNPGGAKISIFYRWYPATSPQGGTATGTVVPVEGGPGYPSILSARDYAVMYGSILKNFNMLSVDLRGTGKSTLLNCPGLQTFSGQASGPKFNAVVAACANSLNHRFKNPNGTYVEASDLFSSAPAANDVASIVTDLGVHKIDLYGDSYGSFFAQTFASRYPQLIRSVILDSTYETQNLDPWYRTSHDNMPANYDNACSRSPACAKAANGPAWSDIEALAAQLRKQPITGDVPGPDGVVEPVTMNVVGLVDLANDGAGDVDIYRDLDAAARALLTSGDPDPLLRLYAERTAFQENYFNTPASVYSGLLYQADSCTDYPQIYNMNDTPAQRAKELAAAAAALPASTFAPFTTQEWLDQDQNTEAYTSCAVWPSPVDAVPPTIGQPLLPPSVPVLILGGEFDTWTPPSDVPKVIAELGGHSRFIELANSTHVVGEGDTTCGGLLVQEFVKAPQSLDTMDASCAPLVAPVHSVGTYAESLAGVVPLTAGTSNTGSTQLLKLGAAAVATAGDAVARFNDTVGSLDHGLHGGTSEALQGGAGFKLKGDVLVPGVAVSGSIKVTATTVTAKVTTDATGVAPATFNAQWAVGGGSGALAKVTGSSNGKTISGSTYAP
ncbi:MAG TPA: alpha/beta fold hydrolase [Acidimicrobiales bacterium]